MCCVNARQKEPVTHPSVLSISDFEVLVWNKIFVWVGTQSTSRKPHRLLARCRHWMQHKRVTIFMSLSDNQPTPSTPWINRMIVKSNVNSKIRKFKIQLTFENCTIILEPRLRSSTINMILWWYLLCSVVCVDITFITVSYHIIPLDISCRPYWRGRKSREPVTGIRHLLLINSSIHALPWRWYLGFSPAVRRSPIRCIDLFL